MKTWVGTSGYAYAAWKGKFYPRDLPASRFFEFYSSRFPAVEINASFWRMPTAAMCAKWAAGAPTAFRFAVKAPAALTHIKRLRGIGALAKTFAKAVAALGERRGPTLVQLPPNLQKDLPLLRDALAVWPKSLPVTVEFRHDSWFADDVYAALREAGAALCIADTDELATPLVATADWGYLRLRRLDYTPRKLADWVRRIRAERWRETYVFTKHEDEAKGTGFALKLARLLARG